MPDSPLAVAFGERHLWGRLLPDHVRLDSSVARQPCGEVDVELSESLFFIRRGRNAHVEDVSTSLLGHAVGPLQCVLEVREQIGVADEDVQAADAPGGCRRPGTSINVVRNRGVSSRGRRHS
jgi:hypothetical protein